jgi:hypothetical protein
MSNNIKKENRKTMRIANRAWVLLTTIIIMMGLIIMFEKPATAALSECTFEDQGQQYNALKYYESQHDFNQFNVNDGRATYIFMQVNPNNRCIWKTPSITNVHFTSVPGGMDAEMHATYEVAPVKRCGMKILNANTCMPAQEPLPPPCNSHEYQFPLQICNGFLQAGN